MSDTNCKKCGRTLIPDPFDMSRFKCPYCGAKHSTVWTGNEPIAGVG